MSMCIKVEPPTEVCMQLRFHKHDHQCNMHKCINASRSIPTGLDKLFSDSVPSLAADQAPRWGWWPFPITSWHLSQSTSVPCLSTKHTFGCLAPNCIENSWPDPPVHHCICLISPRRHLCSGGLPLFQRPFRFNTCILEQCSPRSPPLERWFPGPVLGGYALPSNMTQFTTVRSPNSKTATCALIWLVPRGSQNPRMSFSSNI